MRSPLLLLGLFVLAGSVLPAAGQGARPQFRPAVLPTGADSLVNRIDTDDLLKKGQKDGAVMFCAVIDNTGKATASWTYRAMPETRALELELAKRLDSARFTPPLYNHQPVTVLLFGTVIFNAAAKPHLRILLNQDAREIKEASDFIGPQPVIGGDSKFKGTRVPENLPVDVKGVVDLGIKIDAHGNLNELTLLAEEPPLLGFGAAAVTDFTGAKFIPAFRNGDPVDCETILPVCYEPAEETAE